MADPESFFARVYVVVAGLRPGQVATYGQVASWLGVPRGARAVGWALRALTPKQDERIPWHRVVGYGGRIASRPGPGPQVQRRLLRSEGVTFKGGRVDMDRHAASGPVKRPRIRRRLSASRRRTAPGATMDRP